MSNTTPARRTASALAASALIALLAAAPAAARQDPGTGGRDFAPADRVRAPSSSGPAIDDNSVEYLQVGAGILAGLALAGAGAAMASRRNHREPSTA